MHQKFSLSALVALVFFASAGFCATASFTSIIPRSAHSCIYSCAWSNYQSDHVGAVLGCGQPFENECYCPTATVSVSKAGIALQKCASSRCASGDYTRDLASMKSLYAGYCKDAGYSQEAAALGYSAAPTNPTPSISDDGASSTPPSAGQKSDSGSQPSKTAGNAGASTTTIKTLITQTKTGGADGSGTQVVVYETEVVIVTTGDNNTSSGTSNAVKIGVGVAVPVVVLLLAGLGLFFWRKTKAARRTNEDAPAVSNEEHCHDPAVAEKNHGVSSIMKADKVDELRKEAELESRRETPTNRPHEVPGSYNRAHEVQGGYYNGANEMHGGYNAGLHEAHGRHTRPELPG